MKNNKLNILLRGIIQENPVLILVLGTCPAIATSKGVESAFFMGLAATFVLICSNVVISTLRKLIPEVVRIPCYIVVIATFVTVVDLALKAISPEVHELLGSFLALIVVNCIILGRAEMFARKNNVIDSALDGVGMGLGFLLALLVMAIPREVLGSGSFWNIEIPFMQNFKIPMLAEASGGFLTFGIVIAVMNKLTAKKGGVKRKSFSCEGCPSAHLCNKTSCSEMTELSTEVTEPISEQTSTTNEGEVQNNA